MSYLPIAADIAVRNTRDAMSGAGPEPPAPRSPRGRRRAVVRLSLASALHRVAGWLEPADVRRPRPVVESR